MKITLNKIKIRDIINGYNDAGENGVVGYGGKLNIRPAYQREFIYDDKKRNAVMDTINKGFPLNVMYWVVNDDGTYEVLDGQQRTISFCQYCNSDYSINGLAFHNLTQTAKDAILDYECMVYFCEGNDQERLDWFKTINIAGEKLTDQELRNAVYAGPWLSDAKLKFSKSNCAAYLLSNKYVSGSPIRQDLLQTAITWISSGDIVGYMSKHQNDQNANELWLYFQNVIHWVEATFTTYRKEMKGVEWGPLYDKYHSTPVNTQTIEDEVKKLMMDDDVSKKKGIYPYILTREEKYLSIRAFTDAQKREAFEKQQGYCAKCGNKFEINEMEADHITPWSQGGKTISENCQMLCKHCNRIKSNT